MIVLVVVAAVAVMAIVAQRRRPDVPTQRTYTIPDQLDRAEFPRPEVPWLVAVFTSATCGTCAGVWERARHLDSDAVAVCELEVSAAGDLHKRYGIDAVPLTLVTDAEGVVRRSFVGPLTATDLWAAVAELREPGTLPDGGCQSHEDANQT